MRTDQGKIKSYNLTIRLLRATNNTRETINRRKSTKRVSLFLTRAMG